ncbi:MAG: DUF1203 domain-containing protein [Roseovarius sp.]
MSFQIHALPAAPYRALFQLSDAELAARNMHRSVVADCPGTPCRVSMTDAKVGERVILLNYQHQPAHSPYQATHAIFVRENAEHADLQPGEVPQVIRTRLMSVRLFDCDDIMVDADVVDGADVAASLIDAFDNPQIAYVHLHNAKPGCFAALVTRN